MENIDKIPDNKETKHTLTDAYVQLAVKDVIGKDKSLEHFSDKLRDKVKNVLLQILDEDHPLRAQIQSQSA